MKIKCIDDNSKFFPCKLKMLSKHPKEIYVLGNEEILSEFNLAVIGSRKCSVFGKSIAKDISDDLAKNNIVIVSGFARGIDTIAHNACIENNSKTIAVLGGGHSKLYPKENIHLIDKIIENGGAIISEYPPEVPPLPNNFRERNRIIAALSEGIVLIEAQKNSGSMITVECGKRLNKKIFAVPGCLDNELYEGSNLVLSEGAYCIRNAQDIFKHYPNLTNCIETKHDKELNVEDDLKNVYRSISYMPRSLEEICMKSGETFSKVVSKLTLLEMSGLVVRVEGQKFMKLRKRNM